MENKVFIGSSGFSERLWKGFFYPEELPSAEYLDFYAQHLKTVEINSTFYRQPTAKTLEKWYSKTPDGFRFFIKIPKTVTHIKRLSETAEDTKKFCDHISSELKDKLAGFLFQLPPSFKFSDENLQKVLDTVDFGFLNVFEFRHESWWNETVFETLRKNKLIFTGVSFPKGIPNDVIINSDSVLYYRLHGVPTLFKSEYSEEELNALAEKIAKFKGEKYIYFNNTFGTAGIKNALYLQDYFRNNYE